MSPRVAPASDAASRRVATAGPRVCAQPKARRVAPSLKLEALHPAPVCGVDEAGRGPWAGPVFAAAVILKKGRVPNGVDDSKKLTPAIRERLEREIKAAALAWSVAFASVEEIAELNILHATGLAMRRAVEGLALRPAHALVDGNYRFPLPCPIRTVVQGDAISLSIGAASILAKTARDRVMRELDEVYPGYGFSAHKGYGARRHADALLALGPSPVHRMAWTPVRLALAGRDPMLAGPALDEMT